MVTFKGIKENIVIVQWNARSAVSNKHSLSNFLASQKVDIALISETWFKPGIVIKYTGFNLIREDRIDGKAGVAILIHHTLNYKKLAIHHNLNENILVCGAQIQFGNHWIDFLSVYRPPNVSTNPNDWINIFRQVSNHCIIGGDFNAHNTLWGSNKNDHISRQIIDAVDELNLIILNDGQATRLERSNRDKSVVDLSISSSNLSTLINYNIHNDTLGSDHFPIILKLAINPKIRDNSPHKSKWNMKKANWPLYTHLISITDFNSFNNLENANDKINLMIQVINEAAEKSIPKFNLVKHPYRPPPPWWNDQCNLATLDRKTALATYKNNPSEENFLNYKKICAITKKILKNIARESWRNWCSNLNKNVSSNLIWKEAKKMRRIPMYSSGINDELIDDFFDTIAPPSVHQQMGYSKVQINFDHFLSKPLNLSELEFVLKNRKCTSPGYDEVKYPMIANLPTDAKIVLLSAYNEIMYTNIQIDCFKNTIVIPISKPGKDPNSCDSYRPISLQSCILKTFERMVKCRLEWWMEHNQLFPPGQLGFRKGFGTTDVLSTLVVDIQNNYSRNNYMPVLFLDIKGAYEAVDLTLLKEKMENYFKIPTHLSNCIINIFSNRNIFIRNGQNRVLGPRVNNAGLPQGSVLSPMLFNLYTSDIHRIGSNRNKLKILQYADDFCVYSENKKYETAIQTLDDFFIEIYRWFCKNNFDISQQKSAICVFTRHNTSTAHPIRIGNFNFTHKNNIKYLGMILDKKLSWRPHIDYLASKCNKSINFLKMITKVWWGADTKTCLTFYKAYIRSIIDYGCHLYGSASNNTLSRLDILQNTALRISLGAMKSTPIQALHAEAMEPSLELRRSYLAEKFILKIHINNPMLLNNIAALNIFDLTNKYWIKKKSPPSVSAYRNCLNIFPLIDDQTFVYSSEDFFSSISNEVSITRPLYSEQPNLSNLILNRTLQNWENAEYIYTDASKSSLGCGCAFFLPEKQVKKKFKLNPNFSIFSAEAIAILESLLYINSDTNSKYSIIMSDSLSVLNCIEKTTNFSIYTNPYIIRIKRALLDITEANRSVYFVWVKGHVGIKANEEVDQLAKSSIANGTPLSYKLGISDGLNISKSNYRIKWANQWKSYCNDSPTNYTLIHPKLPTNYWHDHYNLPRRYVSTITRIKFGHACYPAHLHRIKVIDSDECPLCQKRGDLNHLFFECSKYSDAVSNLYKGLISNNIPTPYNVLSLVSKNDERILNLIIQFLKEGNISL